MRYGVLLEGARRRGENESAEAEEGGDSPAECFWHRLPSLHRSGGRGSQGGSHEKAAPGR
jgi:hypothetical protein